MNEVVKAFRALSDETRLRILNVLLQRECCVCEVMQALDISQTRASRNLNVLYNAGCLKKRRDGFWSVYSIDSEGMSEYFQFLVEAVKRGLADNEMSHIDIERLKKAERVGHTCASKLRRKQHI